jgi:primosomal protein N' (replication factor Y)
MPNFLEKILIYKAIYHIYAKMKNMKIVTVVPLKKGALKENLTYFTSKDIPNGSVVVIPLRSKEVLGLVVSQKDATSLKSNLKDMSFNLKKIIEAKEHSIFLKEYFDGAIEISKYYCVSMNNGITSFIPTPLRENYDKLVKFVKPKEKTEIETEDVRSIKPEKLILQESTADRISFYKTLIRESFARKKSVFMVLPTEYDIKKFEGPLSRGIEQFIFSVHGRMSEKKILQKFENIMTTEHPILILGTAPFLSIPREDIKTIIVEHESSGAYKMFSKPHFDLRLFAELFAKKINARFILSDTLLRFETIARKEEDHLMPVRTAQFRINFEGQINILGKDSMRLLNEKFKVLRDESQKEIENAIANKKNVFIFSLRKGLATITVCKDCNEMISCKKCEAPLVLYNSSKGKERMFVCNRCKEEVDGDVACTRCGSWNLMPLGIGTDTVYEYAKEIFPLGRSSTGEPEVKIFKLDKDSVKNVKEAEKIIKEFDENPGSILVGTEMAFFYIQNKISLSVIASFDSLWSIPNFRMGEKAMQIMLSIIDNTSEKLIIQTKNENDEAILAVKSGNILSFVRGELEDRKKLGYPPFQRFIKITHLGDKEQSERAKKVLEEMFQDYAPFIFSGFIARIKGKYVTNALIKLDPQKWSLPEILTGSSIDENLSAKLSSLPISFDVQVDPEDLL